METLSEPIRLAAGAVLYALAYAAGIAAFAWAARRRGFATNGVREVAMIALIGGLTGAVGLQFLFGGSPGRTIVGGIVGGYLAVVIAKRQFGITRPLGDAFAFALSAGEAVGRLGCFVSGCCYGRVTSLPWAVRDHGALRHPTQLYAAAAAALTFALLVRCERRLRLPENALFYLQGAMFCGARFAIEFVRAGTPVAAGLTVAQWAVAAGFIFFSARLVQLIRIAPAAAAPFATA